MSYIINGPVIVGDAGSQSIVRGPVDVGTTGQLSRIFGNILTPDLTTGTGDLIYCSLGGTGALARLGVGSNGQVLTLAAGLPSWAASTGTTNLSFSAFKSGTQAITVAASPATSTVAISGWSTASPGFDGSSTFADPSFTPTVTGTYFVTASVSFTDTSNTGTRSILIRNTSTATTLATRQFQPTPDIAINQQMDISVPLTLTATNVIQLQMTVSPGATGTTSTIQASSSTWWSIVRLS